MDHRRAQPGAVAAVFFVDVLDHLLAPLVLEIDVDIGRFLALLGNEAFEQQVDLRRVDGGDPEAIAHRAVRRRAAALAQDRRVATARIVDDILDGQEIARDVELADQRQLAFDQRADLAWYPFGIPAGGALPGQFGEICVGALAIGHRFPRIFVAQFVEREAAGIGHFAGGGNGVRPVGEQALHLGRALQVALGIGVEQIAGRGDGGLLADAAHHILQWAAVGCVVMDIVGGEDRQAMRLRQRIEPRDPCPVVAAIEEGGGDMA